MPPSLSVIIPALNEINNLPALIRALQAQTRPPDEIIVADAGSTDGSVAAAQALGALVTPGGRPAAGRNAGARCATGDLLFFLDADVLPGAQFLQRAVEEFERGDYAVATTLMEPLEENLVDRSIIEFANLYIQVVQPFSPHAPGFCILVRRAVHEVIGGFNEEVVLAEDHDYALRASKHGGFSVLTSASLPISLRRIQRDGLFQVAYKYAWCEMYALAGKPIYTAPFEYKMGAYLPEELQRDARRIVDISDLRARLGRIENPIQRLSSAGLARLEHFASLDWWEPAIERMRLDLTPPDAAILRRYLRRRLALQRLQRLQLQAPQTVRQAVDRLRDLSLKDSIRLLDPRLHLPPALLPPFRAAKAPELPPGAEPPPADPPTETGS